MTPVVVAGLVVAAVAWAVLFLPGREGFWGRALAAGLVIGGFGLVAQRGSLGRLLRPTVPDVAIGVAAAVALYAVFLAGHRLLRLVLPGLSRQVGELYAIGTSGRPGLVPLVLVVAASGEELFWRGLVQDRAGGVVGLVGYAAVHLWERKAALVLAALVAGAAWAALFAWRESLVAPLVCHILWDLAIVVWLPRPFSGAETHLHGGSGSGERGG